MGLDACVYCNYFEFGKIKLAPPLPDRIYVLDNGGLDYRSDDLEQTMMFDRWLKDDACNHRDGILLHHYLGNMALVSFVRNELERDEEKFPTLLGKVVYRGTHAGDWLDLDTVLRLESELTNLSTVVVNDPNEQHWLDEFGDKLFELIEAAKLVRKPIAF